MNVTGRTDLAELLADLEPLVNCESPSTDLAAVGRSADLIAEIGTRRLGVAPDRIEIDGCSPPALAVRAPGPTGW